MKSILKTIVLLTVIMCLAGCRDVTSSITSTENSVTGIPTTTGIN